MEEPALSEDLVSARPSGSDVLGRNMRKLEKLGRKRKYQCEPEKTRLSNGSFPWLSKKYLTVRTREKQVRLTHFLLSALPGVGKSCQIA